MNEFGTHQINIFTNLQQFLLSLTVRLDPSELRIADGESPRQLQHPDPEPEGHPTVRFHSPLGSQGTVLRTGLLSNHLHLLLFQR